MEITSLFELIAFLLLVLAGCSGIVLFIGRLFHRKRVEGWIPYGVCSLSGSLGELS